jgi:hypothetical protein
LEAIVAAICVECLASELAYPKVIRFGDNYRTYRLSNVTGCDVKRKVRIEFAQVREAV